MRRQTIPLLYKPRRTLEIHPTLWPSPPYFYAILLLLKKEKDCVEISLKRLWFDIWSLFRTHINKMLLDQWKNQPSNFATWYNSISFTIPIRPWFYNLKLCRKTIFSFSRIRIGHTLLSSHSYYLLLNNSPLCILHIAEAICDFPHIFLYCPSIIALREILSAYNVPFDTHAFLSSQLISIIAYQQFHYG